MIKINNLCKSFGQVKAVNHLSLNIGRGISGLVGENGAGKSTLLRLIAGVIYPDGGAIDIDGFSPRSQEAKRDLFFLSDNPYSPSGTNLEGVYEFYSCFYNIDRDKFFNLINKLGLPLHQNLNSFSKGMRRQAFLSLTLAIDVHTYLLDEAFDGLDPLVLEAIKEGLIGLAEQKKTILISSHNILTLERLADKTILLYKGALIKDGDQEHLGEELIKYQFICSKTLNETDIGKAGINVVSLKKIGSIYNLIIKKNDKAVEKLKAEIKPTIFEQIPISSEEAVLLELMVAKKEGQEQHE